MSRSKPSPILSPRAIFVGGSVAVVRPCAANCSTRMHAADWRSELDASESRLIENQLGPYVYVVRPAGPGQSESAEDRS